MPPRIRLFAWRFCNNILASRPNISRQLGHFDASCKICGFSIELDVDILLECPLAVQIWKGSKFQPATCEPRYSSLLDCLSLIMGELHSESFEEFVVVLGSAGMREINLFFNLHIIIWGTGLLVSLRIGNRLILSIIFELTMFWIWY